ncbi:hypothetical protein ACL9RF_01440 [Sphingobacterium sp. Mn56C]
MAAYSGNKVNLNTGNARGGRDSAKAIGLHVRKNRRLAAIA